MDPNQTNNLSNSIQEFLNTNTTDAQRYQTIYNQVHSVNYNEEESFAQKIGPLSHSQLYLLRSQMLAYKFLVRNMPVPTSVNTAGINANVWQAEKQRLPNKAVNFYRDKIQKQQELKNMILGNPKLVGDISQQANSPMMNSNQKVKILVEKRKSQIEHILQKRDQLEKSTQERLQIELKFLNVRDIYQRVLNKVVEGLQKDKKAVRLFERQLLDRSYFRIEKLQRNKEAGNRVQRLQNQMKSDHERRKKIKHKEFMQHLRLHKQQFLEYHRKKQKDRKKIIHQTKAYFQTRKKNKQDLDDKQTIARLKALKQQNMEEYFRLFKEAKNNKIKELLSQTNKFLKDLGAKVLVQKGEVQDQNGDIEVKQVGEDDLESTFHNANNIYYNLTHTVKEEITKQPTMLEGGELKHYQLIGLQWLVSLYNNNLNGILADEMGLGKTIQTISLIAYLIEFKKNYGPFLVVVPLSTVSNWVSEFDKWAPQIKKVVYRGNPTVRNDITRIMKTTKWNVCITTYDFILKDRLRLNKYDWKYIVIDQGHKMKNAKSKFAGVLGQQYQSDHRLLLTGTPLQNNLTQLWALLNFLLPKVFNSCDDFEKWFSMALSKTGGENVQLNQQEQLLIINRLHQVLRPFLLRRIKKEVEAQLPQKRQHVVKIELSAWQKHIYNSISKKTALEYDRSSGNISNNTLSNLMMQLRKCCNHPYLFLKNYDDLCYNDWIFRTSGKFQLLDRILPKLKQFNHRVLIFTQMTHLMDIMQIYFDYKGIKHLRLDGSTKSDDRGQRTFLFNQKGSEYDVFLLSTRAGGLGLNLQTADTVILFDSDWNPQMDLQAQDRAHRIGQKKEVIVLRFITNTPIQQAILQKAAFKINLNQLFIQGGLYNLKSNQAQRRQKIQDVLKKTNTLDESEGEGDQIPDDQMINKFIARDQEEFQKYTQMDEERYQEEKNIYPNFVDAREEQGQRKIFNYRLLRQDQIPAWFVQAPVKKEVIKEYGRGNRVRNQVNYSDEMTEAQFLRHICEDDVEDKESELIAVPPSKKARGRKGKNKEGNNELQEQEYKH